MDTDLRTNPANPAAGSDGRGAGVAKISVIMANHQGERHLPEALASVLAQTHRNLELIVSDDGSSDDSVVILQEIAARDPRLTLLIAPMQSGPAAARNRALDAATGDWIAVMDSDDLMHPDRLRRLLLAAKATGADAVADDLVYFSNDPEAAGRTLLQNLRLHEPRQLEEVDFVLSTLGRNGLPPLGYVKPLVSRSAFGDLRYDETLVIGEDHDLYLRLVRSGARFLLLPEALYLYRRHASSTSHRLSKDAIASMLAADAKAKMAATSSAIAEAYRERESMLRRWIDLLDLIEDLKRKDLAAAAGRLVRHPRLAQELLRSARERMARARARAVLGVRHDQVLVVGLAGKAPPEPYAGSAYVSVPEVGRDAGTGTAELWARLSREAARARLHLVALGNTGLNAAWRVRPLSRITIVEDRSDPLSLPVPPDAEIVPAPHSS